jgi:hypothetical protein
VIVSLWVVASAPLRGFFRGGFELSVASSIRR